jgi:chromate transporter
MQAFREYLDLFSVFFRIGAVTFGGGLAMLPILERELIKKRGWMTAEELVDYFAIGQATPGIVAVNVATFIGHKRKGILGGIVTTAGVVTPSVIVITALALFLDNFTEIQWVQRALRGINVVVAVLLVSAVWGLGRKTVYDWVTAAIASAAFVSIAVFDVSAIVVVVSSALLGLLVKFRDWRPRSPRSPRQPD